MNIQEDRGAARKTHFGAGHVLDDGHPGGAHGSGGRSRHGGARLHQRAVRRVTIRARSPFASPLPAPRTRDSKPCAQFLTGLLLQFRHSLP